MIDTFVDLSKHIIMKKFNELSAKQMNRVKGGESVIGSGRDEGGAFVVVDTGSSCEKRYINRDDFPHVH